MRRTSKVVTTGAMVMAIALSGLLVSCGSSSKKSSASTASSTPTTTSTTAGAQATPAAAPLVTAKKASKLGTVLAGQSGLTLYTLTNNGKPVACTGPCLNAWPPVVAPAGVTAPPAAPGITGLAIVAGPSGTRMVAANGSPLYYFVQDKDSGDAYGEGLKSFGGVWHVVKSTATPTAPAAGNTDTTTSTTPTTSASGY